MLRHKAFRGEEDLRSFLRRVVPSDVYYSSAYYERPEREMEEKVWLGADLVFDIDADHIPTPCAKTHDRWTCMSCGTTGQGVVPQKCPKCGGQRFDERAWPCEVCLESAKVETIKLIDMLTKDFGFLPKEISVSFSGHRGYHVHVESEVIRKLDQMARKEIVDYLVGIGLDTGFHGLMDRGMRARVLVGPGLDDPGWRGRIARGTYEFLLTATREELEKIGLKKKAVDTIIKHKKELLESWKEAGPWGIMKGIGIESWRKIAEHGAAKQSAKIDTVVTTDIHRLIRLGNTLHGKTGLKKIEIRLAELEDFDPFTKAVVFEKGAVTVHVSDAPKFRLGDEVYGPYKEEKIELPTAAALLLLCKRAAKVIE
ncbi:MAG: DNA primase small subunit domain-containing protein [Candidatus Bathyarchaeia archaeon]